jgi:hypothetical protein
MLWLCGVMYGTTRDTGSLAQEVSQPQAAFAARELYAPGHFGNSYEVLGESEMRGVLAEAAFWGFNRYGDWFDMDDCRDPMAGGHTYGLGDALWDRKRLNFAAAQSLGLLDDFTLTPNHVYLDQCLPDLLATKQERVFGQLICPSNPKARALILHDYESLFADLAKVGVRLKYLNACPYDFGGCRCKQCDPWILTFAKLAREIYAIAQRHHPGVKMDMVGWWWTPEEHRQFADWVDQQAPGWVEHMFLHIPYGTTRVAEVPLPKGCQRCAFVHIGYADQANPRDIYGHLGPVIAAERLQKTVAELKAQGVTGVMAYSEGVSDDVNKAILAGLTSGRYNSSDEVLVAYVRRYFGVEGDTARQWAEWLKGWGKPFEVDPPQAAKTLAGLLQKTPQDNWRRRQWELKLQLFDLHRQIAQGQEWTPQRLALVDRFWAVQEQIHRGLWGLAPPRHIFARRFTPLPWYASWAKYKAAQAQTIGKEQ